MENSVNLILQGKGGVGKSFVASLIAQYLRSKGHLLMCFDTDPINRTFSGYKSLNVQQIEIMRDSKIDDGLFDKLLNEVVSNDASFVIDNGASSFVALSHYLNENSAYDLLADSGFVTNIHVVVTGGQALADTINGFVSIADQIPDGISLVVWLNEYFGKITSIEGLSFEDSTIYLDRSEKISGLVTIYKRSPDTFEADTKRMLEAKLTFDDVNGSQDFNFMQKNRLNMVKKSVFDQLDQIL